MSRKRLSTTKAKQLIENFKNMITKDVAEFPNFKATATTLREV